MRDVFKSLQIVYPNKYNRKRVKFKKEIVVSNNFMLSARSGFYLKFLIKLAIITEN